MAGVVERSTLRRRALGLEYATLTWNVAEAFVALTAGTAAGSIALIGFGLDAVVECFAALVVVWQFRGADEERERTALRLIALSFFALAAWVGLQAVRDLLAHKEPAESVPGIVLAAASLVAMPLLARAKRRIGHAAHSHTLVADAAQTSLCAYLSAVLLGGLVLNASVGWWWADPVAALGIALLALHEGREAWRGDACCATDLP
jgi:divalent metal cation (Fe/Co/Zn/Cd) transporter